MSENMKTYRFGDDEITVSSDISPEDVRDAWKEVHPALENAEISTLESGETVFHVQAGTKG